MSEKLYDGVQSSQGILKPKVTEKEQIHDSDQEDEDSED